MPLSLLDTDTLSEVMRGVNPTVRQKASHYLTQFGQFKFSLVTRYEVLRGLKAKNATRQLQDFETFCAGSRSRPCHQQHRALQPHHRAVAGLLDDTVS